MPPRHRWGVCSGCGERDLLPHDCKPEWKVRGVEDEPEDARTVRANSPDFAAEEFVEQYDDDMSCLEDPWEVLVLDAGTGDWLKFRVRAESRVEYYATEVTS